MHRQYYEDIKLHQKRRSPEYHLSEEEIIAEARRWDPQPIHIDPEFARTTRIGSVFAAGVHLLSIVAKLFSDSGTKPALIAGLGWDEVRFVSPAKPGETLVLETEVISKRESRSNPDAGIVTFDMRLLNVRDEPVLTFKGAGLVEKRRKQ